MRLLFVHAHRFYQVGDKFYSSGGLSDEVLSRYVQVFGEVTVGARIVSGTVALTKKLSEITNPNVHIVPFAALTEAEIAAFDCIIARLPSPQGDKAAAIARKHGVPYLAEVVGCAWDAYWNHSFGGKLLAPYMFVRMRHTVRHAPFASYVSERFLQRRYPCGGRTLSCSDVTLPPHDAALLGKRLQKIADMRGKILLGTISAINVRYKGQEYVIRAIARLVKEGYDFEYRLVGGGESSYLKAVAKRNGVADRVVFCGSLPHTKVFDFLDDIDIYIQPSLTEGLPRAVVEAMSRACPAIGTRIGGLPELLSDAYTFKKKSVAELCGAIKQLAVKEQLTAEAHRSFERAKDFEFAFLTEKRTAFFGEYKSKAVRADD